jgi:hypothetical protein
MGSVTCPFHLCEIGVLIYTGQLDQVTNTALLKDGRLFSGKVRQVMQQCGTELRPMGRWQ